MARRRQGGTSLAERLRQVELKQWESEGAVVRRIGLEVSWAKIASVMISGESVESSNFVAGTSGWQIDGDGNAEFNNVTIRGDLVSSNWDGADPADLSTGIDSAATAGFYLDSSAGIAQFTEDVFIGISTDNYIHFRTIANIGYIRWAGTLGSPTVDSYWAGWLAGTPPSVSGNLLGTAYEFAGFAPGKVHLRAFEDRDGYVSIGSLNGQIDIGDYDATHAGAAMIIGTFSLTAGTAAAPSLFFGVDDDTGLWTPAADEVAVTTGGTTRITIKSTEIVSTVPNRGALGSAAAPTWSFDADDDTGMYRFGDNAIGIVAGGTHGIAIDTTYLGTIAQDSGSAAILHNAAGSATTPSFTYTGNLNTGMFRSFI